MKIDKKHPAVRHGRVLITVCLLASAGCTGTPGPDTPDTPDTVPQLPAAWPSDLPPPTLSGVVPDTVFIASATSPTTARPGFDYFSWQSFIALNWPAESGQRGAADQPNNPNVFRNAPNGTPTVWGTYREAQQLFGTGSDRPVSWDSSAVPGNPCVDAAAGRKTLVMATKSGTLLGALNEAFSYPLIDQDSNYVYFEIAFNQTQYDFVRGPDGDSSKWLYLARNLYAAQPVNMPATSNNPSVSGALMVKAAWRELPSSANVNSTRFYKILAQLYDPQTKTCREATMGLVGLHIAQKMKQFPQWIWSTFEHVSNVPGSGQGPYSFNNGTDSPSTGNRGWANRPPNESPNLQPRSERVPVQVTRLNPIPDTPDSLSTVDLNAIYQRLLSGTVWENYELVATQWPTMPNQFLLRELGGVYPQDAGQAFPVNGITNTSAETYFQSQTDAAGAGGNSCMSCHYVTAKTDFSWTLLLRAH